MVGSLLKLSLLSQLDGQVIVRFQAARVGADSLPHLAHRLPFAPLAAERFREIAANSGHAWINPESLPILRDGLIDFPLCLEDGAQAAVSLRIARRNLQSLSVIQLGFPGLSLPAEGVPHVVQSINVVGPGPQRLPVVSGRLIHPPRVLKRGAVVIVGQVVAVSNPERLPEQREAILPVRDLGPRGHRQRPDGRRRQDGED